MRDLWQHVERALSRGPISRKALVAVLAPQYDPAIAVRARRSHAELRHRSDHRKNPRHARKIAIADEVRFGQRALATRYIDTAMRSGKVRIQNGIVSIA